MPWSLPVKRVHAHSPNARLEGEAAALITQIPEPTLARACKLLDVWYTHQPEGLIVGKHVPSRDLAPLLSSLVLYEPVNDGDDWRIRLAGAALLRRFGRDVAGSLVSDLYPHDHFQIIRTRALAVIDMNKPQIDDVLIKNSARTLQHFETVHVPVYAPDGITRWDMAGYFYFD
jgi:hypothetical protein